MVIKVTQIVRDPNNSDNAILTVEYDINAVLQAPRDMDYPMQDIMAQSAQDIREAINDWVDVQRGDDLWTSVEAKVAPYIGQDIEI